MVKLRFARFGRKNLPFYRLVAISARSKRQGEAIEYLGTYDPKTSPSTFSIKTDRVKHWLSVGAQPTDTVKGLLAKEGLVPAPKRTYKKAPGKKRSAQIESENAKKEEEKKAQEDAKVEEEAEKTAEVVTEEKPVEAPQLEADQPVAEKPEEVAEEAKTE